MNLAVNTFLLGADPNRTICDLRHVKWSELWVLWSFAPRESKEIWMQFGGGHKVCNPSKKKLNRHTLLLKRSCPNFDWCSIVMHYWNNKNLHIAEQYLQYILYIHTYTHCREVAAKNMQISVHVWVEWNEFCLFCQFGLHLFSGMSQKSLAFR